MANTHAHSIRHFSFQRFFMQRFKRCSCYSFYRTVAKRIKRRCRRSPADFNEHPSAAHHRCGTRRHEPRHRRSNPSGCDEKPARRPAYHRHFLRRGTYGYSRNRSVSRHGIFNHTDSFHRSDVRRRLHLRAGLEERHPSAAHNLSRCRRFRLFGSRHLGNTCPLQRQSARRADVDGRRSFRPFLAACGNHSAVRRNRFYSRHARLTPSQYPAAGR